MKRFFILTVLFVLISLIGTGCLQKKTSQGNNGRNTNDAALEYMEQKYGEKFEYEAPWGDSMTGTHELLVRCESLKGKDIVVAVSNYKSEDRVFQDNYLAVKYYDETVGFLNKCANDVFGDSKVYYDVARSALSPELPADASFEEYFADESGFISAYIAVKASSFTSEEQDEKVMEPILEACGARYIGVLLVVVDDAEYEILEEETLTKKISRRQFVHCARLTKQHGEAVLEWLED